ncbi:protein-L-isoaspartate(D-aspartate) O-methyltransferase [Janthinobacterium sp. Marseille]|uniref:Protein-L-isoaspartate O-methyltransferase n=1 Tax=Janthinobacterium sp. (strain Marseille) TaxID=375286 RepID=PIMT_JANMA|nr:protein-L-isoaspartate(D-aspartate) O-methyltransferase [Janthinobacterium sp. Marseille]A6SZX9.1 RecName: Full=Protein-L-isoaspartate O-methyltransferase; AltName: Full=L-isoaspartyl protein carboxyl methyltransferase; AltName: Full=Protein L-isoaspartyl methyltransferase; AltName: Full=Protein-beta-aspartate methyltransferase; Short=PIMT [Janthinobacterium sp. Marseille]ABR89362.1 protein-L-isoaspartate(D-aspartate) O-methyltransferase [Janthinobacterium sp. Marseille]
MTEKKRFPLSLSSIAEKAPRSGARTEVNRSSTSGKVATPQTATQNASQHGKRTITPARPAEVPRKAAAAPSSNERATPLVSEAVRKAMTARVAKQGVKDSKVLAAMDAVPRHLFMEPALASQAYIDASLPIGYHQTISQPYIVARMIEVMRNNQQGGVLNRVLEIGTGCGYQAAVLSLVAKEVYSIERIKGLHELAKANLRPMRVANIRLHYGDGMLGLPQAAPFDGIILAAAGLEVPQALLEQMTIGGRLVAPVGERHQVLQLIERVSKFEWKSSTLEDCHFVPLRPGTVT